MNSSFSADCILPSSIRHRPYWKESAISICWKGLLAFTMNRFMACMCASCGVVNSMNQRLFFMPAPSETPPPPPAAGRGAAGMEPLFVFFLVLTIGSGRHFDGRGLVAQVRGIERPAAQLDGGRVLRLEVLEEVVVALP